MLTVPENYEEEKLTIDLVKANIYALVILIPIVLLYGLPFDFLWPHENFIHGAVSCWGSSFSKVSF